MKDTYKYWFMVGELKVHCGITKKLRLEEIELIHSRRYTNYNGKRHYWKYGRIVQVGPVVTHAEAARWRVWQGCG